MEQAASPPTEPAVPRAPTVRPDLEYRPLAGPRIFIFHPQVTGQIVQPQVAEALRLCQGQPISELLPRVREILEYDFTEKEWDDFLTLLADCGYFKDRPRRSPRVRLFDPGPAIDFLTQKCRWLFTPAAVMVLFVLLFVGMAQLLAHWEMFIAEVLRITRDFPLPAVLLFYLCFIPIGLVHELAHGVVCRWHGGEVVEVGLRKNSANLYVLSNTAPLTTSRARILYYAGGAFLDMFAFFLLVNLWLLAPNFVTLMFLLPQALFVLQFSYAMENGSDLSRIISQWLRFPEAQGRWAFVKGFFTARPASAGEWQRAAIYLASITLQCAVALILVWSFRQPVPVWPGSGLALPFWPAILYLLYRLLRYTLLNFSELLKLLRRTRAKA